MNEEQKPVAENPQNPFLYPAPLAGEPGDIKCSYDHDLRGATLIDHFAGLAMQGFIACTPSDYTVSPSCTAEIAYDIAESMLAERAKRGIQ